MPKILINVPETMKEQWVRASHAEMVSLSEWIRRACNTRVDDRSLRQIADHEFTDIASHPLTENDIKAGADAAMFLAQVAAEKGTLTAGEPPDETRDRGEQAVAARGSLTAPSRPAPAANAPDTRTFNPDPKPEPKKKQPRR